MDSLTDLWSDDAFGSTIDGQPRSPSGAEVTFDIWWESHRWGSRPVWVEIVPSYTPPWSGFWMHSQVGIPLTVRWKRGGPEIEMVGLSWQQRWVADRDLGLSVGSLAEFDILTGSAGSGTESTIAGVIAKVLGPGVGYLNGALTLGSGDGTDATFVLIAYKLLLSGSAYIHFGAVSTKEEGSRSQNLLEFSPVFEFGDQLSVSPGFVLGLGHYEITPRCEVDGRPRIEMGFLN